MRSDARVSGEYATKGLMGKAYAAANLLLDAHKFRHEGAHLSTHRTARCRNGRLLPLKLVA